MPEICDMYDYFTKMLREYDFRYDELLESCHIQDCEIRYGRGGLTIHRGALCPSPVLDAVIGGTDRGKLLKALPKKAPDYKYYFDTDGQLRAVVKNDSYGRPYTIEFIMWSKSHNGAAMSQLAAFRRGTDKTDFVSECEYTADGRLVSYVVAYAGAHGTCNHLQAEAMKYGADGLLVSLILLDSYNHKWGIFEDVVGIDEDAEKFLDYGTPERPGNLYDFVKGCQNKDKGHHLLHVYNFSHDEQGRLSTFRLKNIGDRRSPVPHEAESHEEEIEFAVFKRAARKV